MPRIRFLHPQPERARAGDVDRRIRADDDPDYEGGRERVEQRADPRCTASTPINQLAQRYDFVRAKLEAGSMDRTTVKVHPDRTGPRERGSRRGPRASNRGSVLQVRNIA